MSEMKFTPEHEWLLREDDGKVKLGITDYAQAQLGDIVYIELPASGTHIAAGDNLVVIESVKAVGEIKLGVGGTVTEVNAHLADEPELVNRSPLTEGWLVRVALDDTSEFDGLLDAAAYQALLDSL